MGRQIQDNYFFDLKLLCLPARGDIKIQVTSMLGPVIGLFLFGSFPKDWTHAGSDRLGIRHL